MEVFQTGDQYMKRIYMLASESEMIVLVYQLNTDIDKRQRTMSTVSSPLRKKIIIGRLVFCCAVKCHVFVPV